MVVSVSRRCDIPRFKFDWFLERLDAGFAEVVNPFNSRQIRRVPLLPPAPDRPPEESAEVIVFWTRDPGAILEHAGDLERRGYRFYVMITLTAYPALLEPNVPAAGAVIAAIKLLAGKISRNRIIWRYDPVFLSDKTDFAFHRRNFAGLAAALKDSVRRVIVSVYDEYSGAERRLAALEQQGGLKRLAHYGQNHAQNAPAGSGKSGKRALLPPVRELLGDLASIARGEGLEIQSCAEEDLSPPESGANVSGEIRNGACIDGELMEELFGARTPGFLSPGRDRSQKRPCCLCAKSVDIGTYGHCPAGCVYCYAHTVN